MTKISIAVKTLEDFRETFISNAKKDEISVPLKLVGAAAEISTGDSIEVSLSIKNVERTLDLAGVIKWKRMKDINIPGRHIPAGIGIEFDEVSMELLKLHFNQLKEELSNIDDDMAGGNYIKIRPDLAEKYKIDIRKSDYSEKRAQPRISITIPIEIFIRNMTKKYKTLDISLLGMCIATDETLPVGDEVLIIFSDAVFGKQFLIKAVILRNIPDKADRKKNVSVGLKFLFEDDKQKKELMKFIIKRA